MKKIDQNRSVFLKIGFIISISISILAFNWTVYKECPTGAKNEFSQAPEEFEIMRTTHKKKKVLPPPPKVDLKVEVIKDDPDEFSLEEYDLIFDTPDTTLSTKDPTMNLVPKSTKRFVEPPRIVHPPKEDSTVYLFHLIEKMPFMGDCYGLGKKEMEECNSRAFQMFMAEHIKYTSYARENLIEGIVVVQFLIDKTGMIKDVIIPRSIEGGCKEEVLRVIDLMPRWSPGVQGGRPVKVKFTAPVKFQLN